MPINFVKIFQDSWNFILNQRQIMLIFFAILSINNLFFHFLLNPVDLHNPTEQNSFLLFTIAGQLANAVLILWLLSLITLISNQQPPNLLAALSYGIKKIPIYLLLNFIIVLPFSLAATSYASLQGGSIITLLSIIVGIFLFIRLCLAPYSYVIENSSFSDALKLVWLNGVQRTLPLFIFSILVYILPLLINLQLNNLGSSVFFSLLTAIISAGISLFSLVFTYRFYQIFINKHIQRTR